MKSKYVSRLKKIAPHQKEKILNYLCGKRDGIWDVKWDVLYTWETSKL